MGEAALARGESEDAAGRLGGQWVRKRLARLEVVGLEQPLVRVLGILDVTLEPGGDHVGGLFTGPVRGHADGADSAHRQQRQGQRVVTAVELEPLGSLGDEPGRAGGVTGGIFDADDVLHVPRQSDHGVAGDPSARCAPGCRRA